MAQPRNRRKKAKVPFKCAIEESGSRAQDGRRCVRECRHCKWVRKQLGGSAA